MNSASVRLLVLAATLVAPASNSGAQTSSTKIYRGTYFHNFETSAFTLSGGSEPWCVNAAEMTKAQIPGSKAGRATVTVRGELSPRGKYCNLGAFAHILKVTEVVEATEVTSE